MPRPPRIAALLARDGMPFAVVKVEPSTDANLPGRFTAHVRTADDAPLGVFDALREVDDPAGTWILGGDLDVLTEGAAIVLAAPNGVELHGLVAAVISSGAP